MKTNIIYFVYLHPGVILEKFLMTHNREKKILIQVFKNVCHGYKLNLEKSMDFFNIQTINKTQKI